MTNVSETVSAGQLRAFIERIERLEEEKKTIADDIKEVKAEAKGCGFNVSAINALVKLRKIDAASRQEQEAILDIYKAALGMLPLEEYAARDDDTPSYAEATGRDRKIVDRIDSDGNRITVTVDSRIAEILSREPVQEMHKLPEGGATAPISPDPHDPQVDGGQPEQSSIAAGAKSGVANTVGQGGQAPGRHYGEIEQQSASATQAGNEAGSASGASAPISDEGIPAFLKRERKPLRPNCLNPDNCAGYGTHTCHSCTVAAREVEPA